MTYRIFVESQPQNGYQASVIGLPDCVAEGHTEEEAIAEVTASLGKRLAHGKFVTVELKDVQSEQLDNPWLKICGKYKDDPSWDDFQAEMAEYRRELNTEADRETP